MRRLVFPVLALALAGCKYVDPDFPPAPPSSTRLPTAEDDVQYESMNEFAFGLAHEIGLSDGVICPLAVNQSLAVLLNGSDGETYKALSDVLGVVGVGTEAFNASHRSLLNRLNSASGSPLQMAVSLWTVWPMVLDEGYIDDMGAQYDASVTRIGGYRVEAVRMVNDWADERTAGEVTTIIDRLSKEDVILLISVAVFDGEWETPFRLEAQSSPFHSAGHDVDVRLMNGNGEYRYYQGDDLQAVALPYAGGVFEMVALLPSEGSDIGALVDQMDANRLQEIVEEMEPASGIVRIPRFTMQSDYELSTVVSDMGGQVLFGKTNNFRQMSIEMDRGYGVSRLTHRAIVRVGASGRAAASPGGDPGQFEFRADRPFLFVIVETQTGAIVMLGVVSEPRA
ncbi:MAG: hypothetical protein IH945_07210 [Armatimonadetes bacterium]|nr:hypothetical protein [Armatimonadota bacterium]